MRVLIVLSVLVVAVVAALTLRPSAHVAPQPARAVPFGATWATHAPGGTDTEFVGAAVQGDSLIAAENPTGQLRRFNPFSGTDEGTFAVLPGRTLGQVTVDGDTLLVASELAGRKHLTGFGPDGIIRWDLTVPGEGISSQASLVLAWGPDGLTAVGRWSVPGPVTAASIVDGRILTLAPDGTLTGRDPDTGAAEWTEPTTGTGLTGPAVTGAAGTCVHDPATGRTTWCDPEPVVSAVLADGMLYTIGDGTVTATGVADGRRAWRHSYRDGWAVATSLSAPVLAGDTLYLVAYYFDRTGGPRTRQAHELLGLRTGDGAELHRTPFRLDVERGDEPLLAAGDEVYFAGLTCVYGFGAPLL